MKKLLLLLCLPLAATALGAEPPPMPFTAALPTLPPDQEIRIDEVVLAPGAAVPVHRHDAYLYVYVIEGVVEMQVKGGSLDTLQAGQVFTETPADIHTVMRNPSTTSETRLLSFTIKTIGKPPARFGNVDE